ncbi:MAG: winged helix-turn-helix transcriptional regulator [Gammaproteobacteria bacterium]
MNTPEDEVTLELLNAIEKNGKASQRDLARHTGVALGLDNSYINRCGRKGWIKIIVAPANRCIYFVTPTGFSEKMRLTTRYISDSFSFYRRAAESCDQMLRNFSAEGIQHIMLVGISDLAEIVFLKSLENTVEICGVFDPDNKDEEFFSIPIFHTWPKNISIDAVVLTDFIHPDKSFRATAKVFDQEKIFVPDILAGWSGKEINSEHNVA